MKCLYCKFETSNPKFCSKSCAAKHNNSMHPKRSQEGNCKACGIQIPSSRSFCTECWTSHGEKSKSLIKIKDWIGGTWSGGTKLGLSNTIRNYLLEINNYSCSKCGFNTPHPDDNKTILEINHIDGDGTNHSPNNLEVLCPNCHALTSSYRGRNYGNGRPVYYLRKNSV